MSINTVQFVIVVGSLQFGNSAAVLLRLAPPAAEGTKLYELLWVVEITLWQSEQNSLPQAIPV